MTIKELEEYCIDQGIKILNRAMEHEGKPNVSGFCADAERRTDE